jgi:hypothetical protein
MVVLFSECEEVMGLYRLVVCLIVAPTEFRARISANDTTAVIQRGTSEDGATGYDGPESRDLNEFEEIGDSICAGYEDSDRVG